MGGNNSGTGRASLDDALRLRRGSAQQSADGEISGDARREDAAEIVVPPILGLQSAAGGGVATAGAGERGSDPAAAIAWPAAAPWQEGIARRLGMLTAAAELLEGGLTGAAPADMVEALRAVLRQAEEIARPEPTLPIPGQHSVLDWSLARGVGLVVLDELAAPAALGTLVGAALLAGNGVTLAVPTVLGRVAGALRRAGVPSSVVGTLPPGKLPETAPAGSFDFIAANVGRQRAQRLEAALKQRHPGRRGIPAFLGADDAPAAGDAGFLRRFVLARTITTRTLRHGADLAL